MPCISLFANCTETRDVRTADRESGTGTGPLADAQPHNFWVRGLTADLR